jgi:fatty-acyl-CoA synthase
MPPGLPLRLDGSGRFISVGRPLPGIEVRIARAREPGEEGEILVKSPGVMRGYYRNPDATREVLKDGWLHTGDLGFLDAEGYLYVTGRMKNLIVVAGRNLMPRDFEELVDQFPEVRYSAAVGMDSERLGTQRLVVVAEVRDEAMPHGAASHLLRAIVARIHEHQGLRPGQVLLAKKGAIPKTTSGKIQHARLGELLASPDFAAQIVYPRRDDGAA